MKYFAAAVLAMIATFASSTMAFGMRHGPTLSKMVARSSATRSSSFSTTSLHMSSQASPVDFAKSEIESNKVVVFSKSFCPFCKKTKSLLNGMDVDYKLYELNEMDDGADIQKALEEISGQRTVPNVFINGEHVGGNDAMQAAAKDGSLEKMLQ